ncbi:MAG: hypothetical protein WBA89_22470 [Microcoleus sp.]|uniref:hypothetical protein n=1 Tax=Microcoleus sp. TaxID=44472 RepID=UPI003C780AE7
MSNYLGDSRCARSPLSSGIAPPKAIRQPGQTQSQIAVKCDRAPIAPVGRPGGFILRKIRVL